MVLTNCSVANCWGTKCSRRRFPNPSKNMPLFKKWVVFCGNSRLTKEGTPESVFANSRVCDEHFVTTDFGRNNILLRNAYPSLKMPEPLLEIWGESSKSYIDPLPNYGDACSIEISNKPEATPGPSGTQTQEKATSSEPSLQMLGKSTEPYIEPCMNEQSTELEAVPGPSGIERQQNIPSTPKSLSMLKHIKITRKKNLSPKSRFLYEKAMQFKKRASESTKSKLSLKKRLEMATKFTESEKFQKVVSSMDRIRARFFESQLQNAKKSPRGRRYTLEDKVLALALYKHSGASYRFMSKIFALPSRKTVMKLLNRIPLKPGLNMEVFSVLKAEVKNFKNAQDKYCLLMFDEMSIQPGLSVKYNERSINGFEEFGYRSSEQIANHAQVFMLRGIRKKWKQPVFYNFVYGATKSSDIAKIIKIVIKQCKDIGLNVLATVCDQGSNNSAAVNSLIKERKEKYKRMGIEKYEDIFEVDGMDIVPLYDIPHLFKGVRNNLLKYNLTYKENNEMKTAKWEHIQKAYEMDSYFGDLRLLPRISEQHVNPKKINKMKVSKCTQVLSHSMAVAVNMFAQSDLTVRVGDTELKMEKEATSTANLLDFLDQLFDSLNGSSFQPKEGKILRIAITNGSPHIKFWDQAVIKLASMTYVKNGQSLVPPSLKNLIRTIGNFKVLYNTLKEVGFNYMMPRSFNQDPLENFFGQIRQRGQRFINPTVESFTPILKSLLVKNLTSSHSLAANCEDDKSEIFLSLQRLVSQGLPEPEDNEQVFSNVPENLPTSTKPLEKKVLKYVSGYLIRKLRRPKVKNCYCSKSFFMNREGPKDYEDDDLITLKEYNLRSRQLYYVNREFLLKMGNALSIIKYVLNRDLHKRGVLSHILILLKRRIKLTSCQHHNEIGHVIFSYFIKVTVFNYISQINQVIKGQNLKVLSPNASKYFKNAKMIQEKYFNYKKLNRR